MTGAAIKPANPLSAGRSRKATDAAASRRALLRWSHIFSAAVRETLQVAPLRSAGPQPLTLAQFHLLKLVALNGDHQAGELAEFLGVSAPAATKNIDKLVRLGLIRRRAAPDDRRALRLSVSPEGRALVRRHERLEAVLAVRALRSFRPEEVKLLLRLLERFALGLYAAQRVDDGVCLRCAAHIEANCPVGGAHNGCPYQRVRRGASSAKARRAPP